MARAKPVILDTRTFPNHGSATAFFKDMLNRYRPGDRVSDTDAADLVVLLQRHNERDEKVGSGIAHFEVMAADYGTKCFKVVRTDGSGVDFSYQRCIDRRET